MSSSNATQRNNNGADGVKAKPYSPPVYATDSTIKKLARARECLAEVHTFRNTNPSYCALVRGCYQVYAMSDIDYQRVLQTTNPTFFNSWPPASEMETVKALIKKSYGEACQALAGMDLKLHNLMNECSSPSPFLDFIFSLKESLPATFITELQKAMAEIPKSTTPKDAGENESTDWINEHFALAYYMANYAELESSFSSILEYSMNMRLQNMKITQMQAYRLGTMSQLQLQYNYRYGAVPATAPVAIDGALYAQILSHLKYNLWNEGFVNYIKYGFALNQWYDFNQKSTPNLSVTYQTPPTRVSEIRVLPAEGAPTVTPAQVKSRGAAIFQKLASFQHLFDKALNNLILAEIENVLAVTMAQIAESNLLNTEQRCNSVIANLHMAVVSYQPGRRSYKLVDFAKNVQWIWNPLSEFKEPEEETRTAPSAVPQPQPSSTSSAPAQGTSSSIPSQSAAGTTDTTVAPTAAAAPPAIAPVAPLKMKQIMDQYSLDFTLWVPSPYFTSINIPVTTNRLPGFPAPPPAQ